jgi:hypothetical protein
MALAVKAIIGVCKPLLFSFRRIAAVASTPSVSGICTSINTRSNLVQRLKRFPPVDDNLNAVTSLLEQPHRGRDLSKFVHHHGAGSRIEPVFLLRIHGGRHFRLLPTRRRSVAGTRLLP